MIWFLMGAGLGVALMCLAESAYWVRNALYKVLVLISKALFDCGLILCLCSFIYSCVPPQGYEPVTVLVTTENGVIKEVGETYYKDEGGNYYQYDWDWGKVLQIAFYKPGFVKVDTPVFENKNLIVRDTKVGEERICPTCRKMLEKNDNFCSGCGNKIGPES